MRIVRKRVDSARGWLHRRSRRPREAHGVVLMYHRVATASADPWKLCVAPERFESQLRALREHFDLVPLVELRDRLRRGRRSRPVAAITFDDGYVDNLRVAKPLLERHGAPATVFTITGFLGRPDKFWWDRLTDAILVAGPLPPSLALDGPLGRFEWEDAALALTDGRGQASRRRLHDRLWQWLCDVPDAARRDLLMSVERWSGRAAAPDPDSRPMSCEELRELATGGLVDVGAHTVTHPMLSRLPLEGKVREVEGCRDDCRRIVGRDVACFSYPFGDYDPESLELVRRSGFAVACNSRQDLVWAGGDAHAQPRISVRDESGQALLRRLRWYWFA